MAEYTNAQVALLAAAAHMGTESQLSSYETKRVADSYLEWLNANTRPIDMTKGS